MKRFVLIAGLLLCLGLQSPLEAKKAKRFPDKETTADMSGTKSVFLGWVDLSPDKWAVHGYGSQEDWTNVINRLNLAFQDVCKTERLSGKTVVAAKDSKDENAAGQDLYIKFSDVNVDPKTYFVSLSIHFIDPKTNSEIGSIPVRPYSGRLASTFERYIRTSLDEVGEKIHVEVTGAAPKK